MDEFKTNSRRSVLLSLNGSVACADPRAAEIGLDILKKGGNAADAAVAVAAALNVTLPMFTGLGGDAFCLYYNATERKVRGLNGSGRAPQGLTLDHVNSAGIDATHPWPVNHGLTVTVPGAPAALLDTVSHFGSGKLSMSEILQPAISLAENGHAVGQIAAYYWEKGSWALRDARNAHSGALLVDGRAPRWGQVFTNPDLARTLRRLASEGRAGFYGGEVGAALVDAVRAFGGVVTLADLAGHTSTPVSPISAPYRGVRLWEIPPNGQGIVALMALNLLREFDLKAMGHNSTDYLHHLIESFRLSFADAAAYVADPAKAAVPVATMLSSDYATKRRTLINPKKAVKHLVPGKIKPGGDTVYLTTVDADGNACSFIMSNYMGFGTGIVPRDCGFTLQNRGYNFSLEKDSPNVVAPGKRPYHTIIPAMLTNNKTGELLASYGVMGGFMQPQGHVQVLLNMLLFNMDPQTALDQPRFCVGPGHENAKGPVQLEEGIPESVVKDLKSRGHQVQGPVTGHRRAVFGRGHVISRGAWWAGDQQGIENDPSVLWAGSDPRADGWAVGY